MIYLMFLSREIDIKLCQIYAKNYIYKILYKNRRFKQIIFSKYATNLKTTISQRSLKNLGLDQLLKCLGFSLYPPFIFFTVPGGIPLKHLSDTKRVFNSDENYRLFLNQEMRKSLL